MEGTLNHPRVAQARRRAEGAGFASLVFVKATKVCGDIYVPMGAVSFAALVDPPPAVAVFAGHVGAAGATVVDRQTGSVEPVERRWPGLGALAFAGFRHASWGAGSLVQLADDADGTQRFGFVWQRAQDAVVLHWVDAQR